MATYTLKSNAEDQKVYKKKNLSWFLGADIKIHPSGSLFGIARHSLVLKQIKLEFIFYVKTDVSSYWSDVVLYRKSGFGTANGYKLRK